MTKNLIYQKKLTEKINDNDILPKAQVEILLKKRWSFNFSYQN